MPRINIPAVDDAPKESRPILDAVKKQLGIVPNLMKILSYSPSALEGYLALDGALAKGNLDRGSRERIALAVAEINGCNYCLSAHTYLATNVAQLSDKEILAARRGHSADPKSDAVLRFATKIAQQRGQVGDSDIAAFKGAGFDDAAAIEVILCVGLNLITNYVNVVAQTEIDFPRVSADSAA